MPVRPGLVAADAVAARVRACPDVVRLVGRPSLKVAFQGEVQEEAVPGEALQEEAAPGEALQGEAVPGDVVPGGVEPGAAAVAGWEAITVRVVCRFGPTVAELAAQVRAAVAAAVPDCPRIDVVIDDLEVDVPAWAGVT